MSRKRGTTTIKVGMEAFKELIRDTVDEAIGQIMEAGEIVCLASNTDALTESLRGAYEIRQLTEERAAINEAIRTMNDAIIGVLLPADVANACIAVCSFLPADDAATEAGAGTRGGQSE